MVNAAVCTNLLVFPNFSGLVTADLLILVVIGLPGIIYSFEAGLLMHSLSLLLFRCSVPFGSGMQSALAFRVFARTPKGTSSFFWNGEAEELRGVRVLPPLSLPTI